MRPSTPEADCTPSEFVSTAPTDELRRKQRQAFGIAVNTRDRGFVLEWLEGFARFGNDLEDGGGQDPESVALLAEMLRNREKIDHPVAPRAEAFCSELAKHAPSACLRRALFELRERGNLSLRSTQELEASGGAELREAVLELAEPEGAKVLLPSTRALSAREWFLRGYAFEHGYGRRPCEVSAIASYAFTLVVDRDSHERVAGTAIRLAVLTERRAARAAEERALRGGRGFEAPMYEGLADIVAREDKLYRSPNDVRLWLAKAAVRGSTRALRTLVRMQKERT